MVGLRGDGGATVWLGGVIYQGGNLPEFFTDY